MKITQLSIFVENKVGRLSHITGVLAKNGINILKMSLADTTEFGILRIIADDADKAYRALRDADVMVSKTEVVAVRVGHVPGALNKLLAIIGEEGIQIEYMYNYSAKDLGGHEEMIIVLRLSDQQNAVGLLKARGVQVLN